MITKIVNNIIKEDDLGEKIKVLEDSLNKEKIEKENLIKNNKILNIKLKETEEILAIYAINQEKVITENCPL